MKTLAYLIGVSVLIALTTVCVLMLNSYLAQQKKTICYVGMAVMDVFYVGYIGLCFLRLFGIV